MKYFYFAITLALIRKSSIQTKSLDSWKGNQTNLFRNFSIPVTQISSVDFELIVKITFGNDNSLTQQKPPLLIYCPDYNPDNYSGQIEYDNLISENFHQNCYFDQDNFFHKSKHQSFSLTSYTFNADLQHQFRKFPLRNKQHYQLGVIAPKESNLVSYEVTIQLNELNSQSNSDTCLNNCTNKGRCISNISICECNEEWIGPDCSIQAYKLEIVHFKNYQLYIGSQDRKNFFINLSDVNLTKNWKSNNIIASSQTPIFFDFVCYLQKPLFSVAFTKSNPYTVINDSSVNILNYDNQSINNCKEFSLKVSSILQFSVEPKFLLSFYNPNSIESTVVLNTFSNESQKLAFNNIVLIIAGCLIFGSLLLVVIIRCSKKLKCKCPKFKRKSPQSTNNNNNLIDLYNKCMPVITFNKLINPSNEKQECTICLDELIVNSLCRLTICQQPHIFHKDCFEIWLNLHQVFFDQLNEIKNCPNCRTQFTRQNCEEAQRRIQNQQQLIQDSVNENLIQRRDNSIETQNDDKPKNNGQSNQMNNNTVRQSIMFNKKRVSKQGLPIPNKPSQQNKMQQQQQKQQQATSEFLSLNRNSQSEALNSQNSCNSRNFE